METVDKENFATKPCNVKILAKHFWLNIVKVTQCVRLKRETQNVNAQIFWEEILGARDAKTFHVQAQNNVREDLCYAGTGTAGVELVQVYGINKN